MLKRPVRVISSLLLASMLISAVGFLPVAAASGRAVTGDGSFLFRGENAKFRLSAKINRDSSVTGHFHLTSRETGVKIRAELDCLRVVGNVAYMSGVIKNVEETLIPPIKYINVSVQDNGHGVGAPSDLIAVLEARRAFDCQEYPFTPTIPVSGGSIDVRP